MQETHTQLILVCIASQYILSVGFKGEEISVERQKGWG